MKGLAILALTALILALIVGPAALANSSPIRSPLPPRGTPPPMYAAQEPPTPTAAPAICDRPGWWEMAPWMGTYPLWSNGTSYCVEGR